AFDFGLGTVGEARDLLRQLLVPQLPSQMFGKLLGDFAAAASVFPFDGDDPDHDALLQFYSAQPAASSAPPPGSFLRRMKDRKNIMAAPTQSTIKVSM